MADPNILVDVENITSPDYPPAGAQAAATAEARLFLRLIAGETAAYNEIFLNIPDSEAMDTSKPDKLPKVVIAVTKAQYGVPKDEILLDIVNAGGTPADSMYCARLTYRHTKLTNHAPKPFKVEPKMDREVEKWKDPYLKFANWSKLTKEVGFKYGHDRRLYMKFLLRLWRAYYPYEALPEPSKKRQNEASSADMPRKQVKVTKASNYEDASGDILNDDGTGEVDEDFYPDDVAASEILARFGVDDEAMLWTFFNSNAEQLRQNMEDESLAAMVAYGAVRAYGGYYQEPMTHSQLRMVVMRAATLGIRMNQTDDYQEWFLRGVTGGKGKITVNRHPSLQEIAQENLAKPASSLRQGGYEHQQGDFAMPDPDPEEPVVDHSSDDEDLVQDTEGYSGGVEMYDADLWEPVVDLSSDDEDMVQDTGEQSGGVEGYGAQGPIFDGTYSDEENMIGDDASMSGHARMPDADEASAVLRPQPVFDVSSDDDDDEELEHDAAMMSGGLDYNGD